MGVSRKRGTCGQATIELAVAMPVLIIVAVIAVNALTFFGQCAVFDRVVHDAVRVHATAPAYGQGFDEGCSLVEQDVRTAIDEPNIEVSVSHGVAGGDFDTYTATLTFYPTLFGLGLRSEVFGVAMPSLTHTTTYTVDVYKAGVVI